MSLWGTKHQALLNALRAEDLLPDLWRVLSLGHLELHQNHIPKLRDWATCLVQEESWEPFRIQSHALPVNQRLAAFPVARFSARTNHHNALGLRTIVAQLLQMERFASAAKAHEVMISAWKQVFIGGYVSEFVESLEVDTKGEDDWTKSEMERLLLSEVVQLAERGMDAIVREPLNHEELEFLGEVLQMMGSQDSKDPWGALTALANEASIVKQQLLSAAVKNLTKTVESLDLASAKNNLISAPFLVAQVTVLALKTGEYHCIEILKLGIDTLWKLRDLGRDEEDCFTSLLSHLIPLNEKLGEWLDSGLAFGANSKFADIKVFQGELLSEPEERRQVFQRGLDICPGHRNCTMLLSYLELHKGDDALASLEQIAVTALLIPTRRQRCLEWASDARRAISKCEELFPFNKRLDEYKERLQTQVDRLSLDEPSHE